MAVGLVSTVLIFPETLNHHVLKLHGQKQLRNIYALLQIQDEVIHTKIEDEATWKALSQRISALRGATLSAGAVVISEGRLLSLEISHGRIGPKNLQAILKAGRDLSSRAFAMGQFAMMIERRYKGWGERNSHPHRVKAMQAMLVEKEIKTAEARRDLGGQSLDKLMPEVAVLSQDLRQQAAAVLLAEMEWLEMVNTHRYSKVPADFPPIESRAAALRSLEDALHEFRQNKMLQILDDYRYLFDADGKLKTATMPSLPEEMRPLFQMLVYTATLVEFCTSLVDWAKLLLRVEIENPNNVLQFPGRERFISTLWNNAKDEDSGEDVFNFSVHDPLKDDHPTVDTGGNLSVFADDEKKHKDNVKMDKKLRRQMTMNPDARRPVNIFQRFNVLLVKAVKALTSSNGVFAARYAFISIALWIPAVCNSSAKFYYANRGVWALIMAQSGLGVTAGEQVANFVTRMSGTVLGVVVGMVAWYIGAPGNAHGNPYGVIAATMCLLAPWLFMRVNCPMRSIGFWMMITVTIAFLVGYSWDDNHVPQTANQGSGASLAGRRALLVLIGFVGAIAISVIPKPVSAKVLVRQGISKNIASLGELYGLEVVAFETGKGGEDAQFKVEQRKERFRHHFFKIFMRLQDIEMRIALAKFEPNLTGPWPIEDYLDLVQSQKIILAAGAVLSGTYQHMDEKYCRLFASIGGIMDPMFIADCFSLFALLRHALRNGAPLPPIIPILDRLAYHRKASTAMMLVAQKRDPREERSSAQDSQTEDGSAKESDESDNLTLTDAEDRLIDQISPYINWGTFRHEQFAIFATALVSLVQIVNGLNQMHIEILRLVGTHNLEGLEQMAERWAHLGRSA